MAALGFWLKLRSAAEQRNNWAIVASSGVLIAIAAAWDRLRCIDPLIVRLGLAVIAIAAVVSCAVIVHVQFKDARKLKVLIGGLADHPGFTRVAYRVRPISLALVPILMALVVVALLVLFGLALPKSGCDVAWGLGAV